jgi:OmpA-OmpF porin, OOP family
MKFVKSKKINIMKKFKLFGLVFMLSINTFAQYSKFEETNTEESIKFKRGDKIIFQDNFEKDAIGDFPAKWQTSLNGEVKKLKGFDEKFLKIPAGAVVNLPLKKPLPKNFTIEFDILMVSDLEFSGAGIAFGSKLEKGLDYMLAVRTGIQFNVLRTKKTGINNKLMYGTYKLSHANKKIDYNAPADKKIHIAFEVNDTRIRLYIDSIKKVDLPSNFLPEYRKFFYLNSITNGWAETKTSFFFVTNFIMAETGTDARSQVSKSLLDNGSFSTNAILFDNNSDKITTASNTIITEIANTLKEYTYLKLNIIGHTDSDGDNAKNITLSKKRAEAVKQKLASMGILANRLSTNGKGETMPIASNENDAGKAENRRVEFVVIK